MAKAMVSTVRPKASETPSRPMPTSGKAAASTALPQPPSTSQKVPKNSAAYFFMFLDLLIPNGAVASQQRARTGLARAGQPRAYATQNDGMSFGISRDARHRRPGVCQE